MRLPKEIVTKNKIRDFDICRKWLYDDMTSEEIGGLHGISARQVNRILYKNRTVLKLDKDYEKQKRIHWYKRQIKNRGNTQKDVADLVDKVRLEIEGEKASVEINTYTQVWNQAIDKTKAVDERGRVTRVKV